MAFECCNNCETPLEYVIKPLQYEVPSEVDIIAGTAVATNAGPLMYCPRCGNVQVLLQNKEAQNEKK